MGIKAMLLDLLRPHRPPLAIEPPPIDPERIAREAEAEHQIRAASTANSRAAMGVVVTAGKAFKAESGVQKMMRGVLREVDGDHDGTH